MKQKKNFTTIFFVLIFSLTFSISSKAQEGFECSIQECIDYYASGFSGTVAYIKLSGTITDLTPLQNITSVTGNLTIDGTSLTSLNGLGNITSVGGDVTIINNTGLTDLSGLEKLTSVSGSIYIGSNAAMTSLSGLSSLSSFNILTILQNNLLTSLRGLENLTSVTGTITIQSNPSITSMAGLENLTSVGGHLTIAWNDALTELTGLSNLTSVGGNIFIGSNYVMTTLDGLEKLTSVTGEIDIQHNNLLTNVDGLTSLASVGSNLMIWYNDILANLNGLKNLSSVGGDLMISENPKLISFCGLYPLFTTGTFYDVGLYGNGILFPFGPDGPTQVEQVIALGPCEGSNVTVVSVDIFPETCPNALNARGKGFIPAAILGTAEFDIQNIDPETLLLEGVSPARWSIKDVATPVSSGENCDCTIEGPDGYVDLNLKFDAGELVNALGEFEDGDELLLTMTGETLDGTPFEGSDCVVILAKNLGKALVDNLSNVSEEYALFENYPNPFNPSTIIKYELPKESFVSLILYDVLGREVAILVNNYKQAGIYETEFNAANLPSGIYIYRLKAGDFISSKKMILQK